MQPRDSCHGRRTSSRRTVAFRLVAACAARPRWPRVASRSTLPTVHRPRRRVTDPSGLAVPAPSFPFVVRSHARGEARHHGDVDLLIDVDPNARFKLLHLAAIQGACQEALGLPTYVLTREALDPETRAAMERDTVQIFG